MDGALLEAGEGALGQAVLLGGLVQEDLELGAPLVSSA